MAERGGGRSPSLTARGRAWAFGGAMLVLMGALTSSWRTAGLGVLALGALGALYLAFFPTAILIWRRYLEMKWGLERPSGDDAFVVGRAFKLTITLRSRGPRALGRARVRVFGSSAIAPPPPVELDLGAEMEATRATELCARKVGYWHLHGAAVEIAAPLGIATVEAYFPSPIGVKVFPRPAVRAIAVDTRPTAGAPHERLGLHAIRHRGLGGDLRELRDHAPGDPFKQIAWKATARTGKLMVRDLDRETMVTHYLLVDQGATMRDGRPGASKLDYAVDLAAAYARGALEAGDRVGLITFDGRIVGEVKPNDGPVHRLRLVELLMAGMNPVDEDLTELTDSELVQSVARYLVHQEGVDARLTRTPAIDDPAWAHLATAPSGELYDLRVLLKAVNAALGDALAARAQQLVVASGPEQARLRLYCRHRGIELPHRRAARAGRRALGLAAALERAAAGRGMQRIVVLSDLEGLDGRLDVVARAVRLARRRGHRLVCAQPAARLFGSGAGPAGGAAGRRDDANDASTGARDAGADAVADVIGWELDRRERTARRKLAALGVRVVPIGPGDAAAATRLGEPSSRAGAVAEARAAR
jgi:uncharacterized protein (DUF58 family)